MDVWSIFGILLVVAIAGWGIKLFKNRIDEQRYQQELADMHFEETALNNYSLHSGHESDARFQSHPVAEVEHTEISTTSNSNQTVISEAAVMSETDDAIGHLPAPKQASPVFRQLEQAGMLGEIEGYIELHGNSKGAAIIRMRNGKRAIIVPHMESESFLRRHAKRVDMIIMTGVDGKAVVVTPLEELIAQNLFPTR